LASKLASHGANKSTSSANQYIQLNGKSKPLATSSPPAITSDSNEAQSLSTSLNSNENSCEHTSSSSTSSKSPIYNWKKWKKGQAWRYNSSSSNVSQYDATSSTESNPSHLSCTPYAYGSNSFDSTSLSSYNTSGSSYGNESGSGENKQTPNLSQIHNINYSSSFDSALTGTSPATQNTMTTMGSHLSPNATTQLQISSLNNQWSSTSKLDAIKNDMNSSGKSAQKRRGKLVRDRTIDNADEQQTCGFPSGFSHFNVNNGGYSNKVNIIGNMNSNSLRLNDLYSKTSNLKEAKDIQSKNKFNYFFYY
jgi:hypothetical protein